MRKEERGDNNRGQKSETDNGGKMEAKKQKDNLKLENSR